MNRKEHYLWHPHIPYCQSCSEQKPDYWTYKYLPNNGIKHCISCGDCLNNKPFRCLERDHYLCIKEKCLDIMLNKNFRRN